jgi:2-keto-4-pentenoate hydratase/2-oxohepta-3-ene-1,7-dioic acid hydratase in catechol pathway
VSAARISKAIEAFCPIGPHVLTADEVDDRTTSTWSSGSTARSGRSPTRAICRCRSRSWSPTTRPQVYSTGDLITTGTVTGVAASTDDPFANYLKPGDVVEAEIEKLGILRNPVISWRDAYGTDAPAPDSWM